MAYKKSFYLYTCTRKKLKLSYMYTNKVILCEMVRITQLLKGLVVRNEFSLLLQLESLKLPKSQL